MSGLPKIEANRGSDPYGRMCSRTAETEGTGRRTHATEGSERRRGLGKAEAGRRASRPPVLAQVHHASIAAMSWSDHPK